jgi:DNA-binding CsgD family transcriptional regulator
VVSGLSTTIHVGGRAYGVMSAHTSERRLFTEDEILFLQEVAEVLGAAIERRRTEIDKESLLDERTAWATATERRFSFLAEANALLSASADYGTVLSTAARLTVPAIADWCFVDVVEETEGSVSRFAVAHCAALALNNARHRASEVELVRELVRRASEGQRVISLPRKQASKITPRQMEVLQLLSSGHSTREIGRKLYLSEATVHNHIRGLLQAFGAHSQLEVLARAREAGTLRPTGGLSARRWLRLARCQPIGLRPDPGAHQEPLRKEAPYRACRSTPRRLAESESRRLKALLTSDSRKAGAC